MPDFCDVAVPVPLDMVFTYRVPADASPVVGGRVLIPFRQQRMTGIVVELHDRKPSVATKNILSVLDLTPVLDAHLLQLGRWIADYYLAPLGEVFRTMLPLNAEFKRSICYRLTEEGQMALHQAGVSGSSARSKRTPEEQAAEFRVLDYLAGAASDENEPEPDRGMPRVLPMLRDVGTTGARALPEWFARNGWRAKTPPRRKTLPAL
jgi:primosomal protein N' (replication factor Y)